MLNAHCVRWPQAPALLSAPQGQQPNSQQPSSQAANSRETARRMWRRGLFGIRLLAVRGRLSLAYFSLATTKRSRSAAGAKAEGFGEAKSRRAG
jgi:hypothetical protein